MNELGESVPVYHSMRLDGVEELNTAISNWFFSLDESAYRHRSHFFGGRYENIYIDEQAFPALSLLIQKLRTRSAEFLDVDEQQIKLGFWFNTMSPGHATSRHNHHDDDEKISGVYYLSVPADSGNLVLYTEEPVYIEPEEGKLVLFPPTLEHEVLKNMGKGTRLSVGFNVGIDSH